MANPLQKLGEFGQSVWYDNISRAVLQSGVLAQLVSAGEVRGVTSNPTIFEKAIGGSADYDGDIRSERALGKDTKGVYEALAIRDIRAGADLLRPVYDTSGGADGFISMEVSPELAHDAEGTVAEARRLHAAIDRPNLMIKVPATPEGCQAIEELIGAGVSVNVTLMFSHTHYEHVVEAYLRGLEKAAGQGLDLSRIRSVASVFVSRIDSLVDKRLQGMGAERSLFGKAAIANTQLVYARFGELFSGPRWAKLAAKGAAVQRPLWASTSTKNPLYRDVMYVEQLIGPDTVNTMPPQTIDAFRDHGEVARTVDTDLAGASALIGRLSEIGVDMEEVGAQLQDDGVAAFADSFHTLLAGLDSKVRTLEGAARS